MKDMKNRLYDCIGNIDDDIINETEKEISKRPRTNNRKFAYFAYGAAACVLLAAMVISVTSVIKNSGEESRWPTKEITGTPGTAEEIPSMPKWDELSVSEKYIFMNFNGKLYDSRIAKLQPGQIGDSLGKTEIYGIDFYTEEKHYINGDVYTLDGISENCALAVKIEGEEDFFAYVNSYYKPDTLGQFIYDLNLRENMDFGSVWYYVEKSGKYTTIEFVDVPSSAVWDMLLSDLSIENVKDYDSHMFINKISISVNIPVLGYKNISLGVTEDGYLTTNILATGKAFFIGENKAKDFEKYITENCQGYEIVYTGTDTSVPE